MSYRVEYSETALKQLRKMDRFDARLILSWVEKRLVGCDNQRLFGKGLSNDRAGEWRYRVGDYRLLCQIQDDVLIIEVFAIGHRKEIYSS